MDDVHTSKRPRLEASVVVLVMDSNLATYCGCVLNPHTIPPNTTRTATTHPNRFSIYGKDTMGTIIILKSQDPLL